MLSYDRQIAISSAGSRKAIQWPAQSLYWSEMIGRLQTPARGTETMLEYLALTKGKQDDLKDVGGFVAGLLANGRRKSGSVLSRDVITLDLDNIPAGGTKDVLRRIASLGCAFAVYSTRKHDDAKPRLRVLLPLNRAASADEYEPIARKLAGILGIELCDPTTFEASRLMYWPSCCADSQYVYQYGDKPFADADGLLATYANWYNMDEWPQLPGVQQAQVRRAAQQGDPTEKNGVIGAFCKTYDIYRAIDTFLPVIYDPCADGSGRYTFTGGSTVGGAVVYDNGKFLFSHHATDPAGGKLCNSFDLVRLHKFGSQDDDVKPDTPTNKLPSYVAMCGFVVQDTQIAALLNQERYDRATKDFETPLDDNENWISKLEVNPQNARPAKTIDNVLLILENDPSLKGKLAYEGFSNRCLIKGALPWNSDTGQRDWDGPDDSGLKHHLEHVYRITLSESHLHAAWESCLHKHKFNMVQDYLTALKWDGVKRLDTLLTDYLGAEDNIYTRAVIRKSLTAAVTRAMLPGCKYDFMPIFTGPQGLGKSTFIRMLGRHWFSDSMYTFAGKDGSEMLRGIWINELGELNGMGSKDKNAVKQFLSRVEDIYRAPYGKHTAKYPRSCVFFGTTNDYAFLKDTTGNRRFWPIAVGVQPATKSVFNKLENEVDQIWAEAFLRWQSGEPLYLSGEVEKIALLEQEDHRESSAKEGIILDFVEREIPLDWAKRTLNERRMYWSGDFESGNVETTMRDRICAAEVWCECFNKDISFMERSQALEINNILEAIRGLKRTKGTSRFGKPYGLQRGFSTL